MTVSTNPVTLMVQVYKKIFPNVEKELSYWQKRASEIPNEELRKQALASIKNKRFHCEGGAILALLAQKNYKNAIRFIVAYQTISDYLDNLCDRSTSQDPQDFQALHEAMRQSLIVDNFQDLSEAKTVEDSQVIPRAIQHSLTVEDFQELPGVMHHSFTIGDSQVLPESIQHSYPANGFEELAKSSLTGKDFQTLPEKSVTVSNKQKRNHYYRFRHDQDDGGYLQELVETCQQTLSTVKFYPLIKKELMKLCDLYCQLQIHKHVRKEERIPRLQSWFNEHKQAVPNMEWYEFSACTGSTLGIFCLVSYAMSEQLTNDVVQAIYDGYFPYIQGLHILLDYLIDQEEDLLGGDLNFCFYYENREKMLERLLYFVREANRYSRQLPDPNFHQLIISGLLGLYLSDQKVKKHKDLQYVAKKLLKQGGLASTFFYMNGKIYRKFQQIFGIMK